MRTLPKGIFAQRQKGAVELDASRVLRHAKRSRSSGELLPGFFNITDNRDLNSSPLETQLSGHKFLDASCSDRGLKLPS